MMRNQRVVERISQMLCTLPFFAKFYLLSELHVRNVRTCVIFLSFFSDFLTHALQYMVECMSTNLRGSVKDLPILGFELLSILIM